MISKLLGMATVGSSLASLGMLHRFLLALSNIMILAIASAFILCALFASIMCTIYFGLVYNGWDPNVAGVTLGLIAILITAILFVITLYHLGKLRDRSHYDIRKNESHGSRLGRVVEAFLDGLLSPKK